MHDTASHIGSLAMNIYADLSQASVLEIGSKSYNGSLRGNSLPTTRYVGLDLEDGEGVDLVIKTGEPLPVEDASFDLVMASSVFEHDPCFWVTFLEMCRATKDGGYIYINAPSNGAVHRYPQDNWRFYPDSGRALAKWAVSQGQPVTLMESFVAEREADIWNDFVAVFRKGRITAKLPSTFLHEHVPSVNVFTWRSTEVLRPRAESQDIVLLNEAQAQRGALQSEIVALTERLMLSEHRATAAESSVAGLEQKLAELQQLRNDLTQKDSELRQRAEEIEQTRRELDKSQAAQRHAEQEVRGLEKQLDKIEREHGPKIKQLQEERERAVERQRDLTDRTRAAEASINERYAELATLTSLLRQSEQQNEQLREHLDWSTSVRQCCESQPTWWKFMPERWRLVRERRRLKRAGLFDHDLYLERYPDVAAAGLDALDHYLRHGHLEGRSRNF